MQYDKTTSNQPGHTAALISWKMIIVQLKSSLCRICLKNNKCHFLAPFDPFHIGHHQSYIKYA